MFICRLDAEAELRLLEDRHATELFLLTDQNRDHLRRWLPWVDVTASIEITRKFIRNALKLFAANRGFQAGIWYQGRLAGVIGYHRIDWFNRKTSIGYWLGASFQGKGLMTKACRALVDYAFHDLKLNRVEIRCAAQNKRSRAIPERLGFTQEGVSRQAEWLYDHYVDHVIYAMLASEWRGGR
ncbi:MAG: alanine acetyltransferase [Candidatus Fraserbacteria bacterium RBG_16_55_9]|uniref:Alanine acetyltransferase n=1 Tax=Fraserbacteria sp. (strain RBG_16_55_9) TaxID=1817864 RepID=A0A1F5UY23_FRAXR|nr:MAG: alanine acetyltransferase [Candidatus Fraserbacteria bacterium RBG_16_55_9]